VISGSGIQIHNFLSQNSTIFFFLIEINWYRGYSARLKARQRYALTIFQSIEYADEQGQLQVCFASDLKILKNFIEEGDSDLIFLCKLFLNTLQDYKDRQDYVSHIDVPDSYHGPRLQFPLTFTDIDLLVEAFKQQQASGSRYCPDSCT
uniref:Protein phosphatase with EF-hand domain 1 n=1 Tax=Canis lupus dingo TaxID=286419 RepID=A0A8C0QV61_CANLU